MSPKSLKSGKFVEVGPSTGNRYSFKLDRIEGVGCEIESDFLSIYLFNKKEPIEIVFSNAKQVEAAYKKVMNALAKDNNT